MGNKITNKAELLLSLLYAGEDYNYENQQSTEIEGITRLEKLLFLLKNEKNFLLNVSKEDDFNFFAFRMGPWTNEVYDEVDFLDSLGFLEKEVENKSIPSDKASIDELFSNSILDKYQKDNVSNINNTEKFRLTDKGRKKGLEIWNRIDDEEKKNIIDIKRKFNKMNLTQFLRYVYKKYPEYTTESEIKDSLGCNF